LGQRIQLARPSSPESREQAVYKNLFILNFNYYICILHLNTSSVIYICYIFYEGQVKIGMLTIRDNELNVGDDEVTLSDVAGGGNHMGQQIWLVRPSSLGSREQESLKTYYFIF